MISRYAAAASIAAVLVGAGSCTRGQPIARDSESDRAADRVGAPETPLSLVALPNLDALEGSVQTQIRGRYTRLVDILNAPGKPSSEVAVAYADLGRLFLAAGFNEDAESCYRHAQTAAPTDMRWQYDLGHVYLRSGDRDRAAIAFTEAARLAPSDVNSLIWLGTTYLDSGRLNEAQTAFSHALVLQPQSPIALFGAGRVALALGLYADAVSDLERALAVDSRASAVHYPLAMAYRGLGDAQRAAAHLRQRGDGTPELDDPLMPSDDDVLDSTIGFEHRGMRALKEADFAGAIQQFNKGLELNPDDITLRYWLAAAQFASGDAASAEKGFRAVLQRSPLDAKAHFSLGAIDEMQGRRREAIDEYTAAVRSDPTLPEARLRLAKALRTTGDLQASLTQYEHAVESDPRVLDAWIGGAQTLINLSRYEQAREWLSRARKVYPDRKELADLEVLLPR